jgi:transcriptional regulator with XRE-family HTH domain
MNQAAIGQYIAGKRTAQGMTQEQLAQKIGVSQKSLMRWETGKRLPDADAVEALCTALGITLPELLNGKDSPQKEEMQLTHDAQMLDLLRRMQRTVYEQHILYGVLLILLGIASNALSAQPCQGILFGCADGDVRCGNAGGGRHRGHPCDSRKMRGVISNLRNHCALKKRSCDRFFRFGKSQKHAFFP